MDASLLGIIGVAAAAGFSSWAIVMMRKNVNGQGSPGEPRDPMQAPLDDAVKAQTAQAAWTDLIKQVGDNNRNVLLLTTRVAELAERKPEPQPSPEWVAELDARLAGRLQAINDSVQPPAFPPEVAASLDRITDRLEALIQMGPPPLPAELADLPDQVAKKQEETGRKMLVEAKSGQSIPPPKPPKNPPQPRMIPDPLPPIPHIPPPYVGGTVIVPGGQPANLLLLIQQQLQPNCPGTCVQFRLSADSQIYVGAASFLGGPLTADNYAYVLEPGDKRIYQSAYPGSSTPIGDLQVLGSGALHVEVQL